MVKRTIVVRRDEKTGLTLFMMCPLKSYLAEIDKLRILMTLAGLVSACNFYSPCK
jgi:hypothetical protein